MDQKSFHTNLKDKINRYAHFVYKLTRNFPREELYGITSQLRRSSLSVALNYVEGFARGSQTKVNKNFVEIAYGSLKESEYLLRFAVKEGFLDDSDYGNLKSLSDEIGGMLYGILRNLKLKKEK